MRVPAAAARPPAHSPPVEVDGGATSLDVPQLNEQRLFSIRRAQLHLSHSCTSLCEPPARRKRPRRSLQREHCAAQPQPLAHSHSRCVRRLSCLVPAEAGRAAREPSTRRSLHAESRRELAQLYLRVECRARRDSLLPPSSLHTLSLRCLARLLVFGLSGHGRRAAARAQRANGRGARLPAGEPRPAHVSEPRSVRRGAHRNRVAQPGARRQHCDMPSDIDAERDRALDAAATSKRSATFTAQHLFRFVKWQRLKTFLVEASRPEAMPRRQTTITENSTQRMWDWPHIMPQRFGVDPNALG